MKKGIFYILLIVFLVFVSTRIVSASFSLGRVFGGRIVNTKALEIQALESSGYQCYMPGTSISILPIGSPAGTPTSYFIPSFVISKTRTTTRTGQLIMGRYLGKTIIPCIFPSSPPMVISVSLDIITLFGTSK